jgi:hypothetical protein
LKIIVGINLAAMLFIPLAQAESLEELNKQTNWLDLVSQYTSASQKESSNTLNALKSNDMDALLITAKNRQYNAELALKKDKKIEVPALYQTANTEWVEQLKDERMSAIYLQQFAKNSKNGVVDESTYSWYEYYTKSAMTHMDSVTALL